MTNKDLANIIFPNINKTIDDYEKLYPKRNNIIVTRFAPSPTGFMHIGNFMSALIDYVIAKHDNGVFYLRNEDTDSLREIEGAIPYIRHVLSHYKLNPDEYEYVDTNEIKGIYGPYIQSKRKEIYQAFIKHLLIEGKAYPCFLTQEEMNKIREEQTKAKKRIGIYGKYAKYRDLSIEEAINNIQNGMAYTIRLKSNGNFYNKFKFNDLVNGEIEFPENDIDVPIMKSSNGLPTYHFAHLVDDHLMRTTHVVRGQEWLSSVPIHQELFKTFGFEMPNYIHNPLILKKDGDKIRKISKRLDPEARMTYYEEKGYPIYSVIEAVMTIINSNYEEWRTNNPNKDFTEFEFDPTKMSPSGALFDLDKLDNISKNYISKLTKDEVYNYTLSWAEEYDKKYAELLNKYKNYSIKLFNIEREQAKPRKDYACWQDIRLNTWYMYDELFDLNSEDYEEINNINEKDLLTYISNIFDENNTQEEWFNNLSEYANTIGFTSDRKAYKENPDKYNGITADFCKIIRIIITKKNISPNLYDIMNLLGKERLIKRINRYFINKK